jgi:hypothetical protein
MVSIPHGNTVYNTVSALSAGDAPLGVLRVAEGGDPYRISTHFGHAPDAVHI